MCFSGPGREPCLNADGSKSLAWAWVSPAGDNSIPSHSEHSGTKAASHGPLHSGILRSALNPPLWPLTALPGLPSPKLLASSESHTPKRLKGQAEKPEEYCPPLWVPPKVTGIQVLTGAVG